MFTWSISPFLEWDNFKEANCNWVIFNMMNMIHKLVQRSMIILLLSLAICMSLDLRFVVSNPLYPENRRMIVYNFICAVFLIAFLSTFYSLTDYQSKKFVKEGPNFDFKQMNDDNNTLWRKILVVPLSI